MWIWRLLCLAYLALLSFLLLAPNPGSWLKIARAARFAGGRGAHFAAFAALGFLVGASRWPLKPRWTIAALLSYAVLIELAQRFFPPRTVEVLDLVENFAGLSLGLGTWLALVALWPGAISPPGAAKHTQPVRPDPRRLNRR